MVWSGIVRVEMRDVGSFRSSIAPADASGSDLRARLVARTSVFHGELERLPLMTAMADGRAGQDDYVRWLRLQWEVHAAYEPRLRTWVDRAWADARLVKAGWLSDDLAALGQPPTGESPLDMSQWPAVSRPGDAWGVQYVLEGSTLGALVIRDGYGDAGHPFAGARRFLEAYGSRTPDMWRAFVARLADVSREEWEAASDSAEAMFAGFLRHFGGERP